MPTKAPKSFEWCIESNACQFQHTTACAIKDEYGRFGTQQAQCYEKGKVGNTTCAWYDKLDDKDVQDPWARCLCKNLYFPEGEVGCSKEVKLGPSYAIAFLTLLVATVAPPVLFLCGYLARASKRARLWGAGLIYFLRKETTWYHQQEASQKHEKERLRNMNDLVAQEKKGLFRALRKRFGAGLYAILFLLGSFLVKFLELVFSTFIVSSSMRSVMQPNYLQDLARLFGGVFSAIPVLGIALEELVLFFSWFDFAIEVEGIGVTW